MPAAELRVFAHEARTAAGHRAASEGAAATASAAAAAASTPAAEHGAAAAARIGALAAMAEKLHRLRLPPSCLMFYDETFQVVRRAAPL